MSIFKTFKSISLSATALLAALPTHAMTLSQVNLAVPDSLNDTAKGYDWDRLLSRADGRINFGISLHGPSPYTRNSTTPFAPASNSKLFTAGLVLERLGADSTFTTTLAWSDVEGQPQAVTNLVLRGSGDPSWGLSSLGETLSTRVDALAAALAAAGARTVYGDIQIRPDDARLSIIRYPEGWTEDDRATCDGALAQTFNVNLNCAHYEVKTSKRGAWVEPGVPTPVTLNLKLGAKTNLTIKAIAGDGYPVAAFTVSGTLKRGGQPVRIELPVPDANTWVRNLLAAALKRRQIELLPSGSSIVAAGAHQLEFDSPTIGTMLKPFLKNSHNLIGDALLKSVASRFGPAGAADLISAGQSVLHDYVRKLGAHAAVAADVAPQPGFYESAVELFDGSGLSRTSHVTTDAMMALMLDLRSQPDFKVIWDSLPIAGVDGTLAGRMKRTAAEGVLRAKTGTLNGVYNLSGYVPRKDTAGNVAEYVPFVILTQTSLANEASAHQIEDTIGVELVRELEQNRPAPRP